MLRVLVLAMALGACLKPSLVECGDLACAAEQVCHDNRCLDPSLLDACEAQANGTACDANGAPGRCVDEVCEVATCGDGFVDADLREECDASIPAAHCIDFGYDLGRPACTACQPDPAMGCVRFGWQRIIDAPTSALWTDGSTFAYLTAMGVTVQTPTSTTIPVHGMLNGVHGGSGHIVVWDQEMFADIVGDTVTMVPTQDTEQVRVAADGVIHTLRDCRISKFDGSRLVTIGPRINETTCSRFETGDLGADGPSIFVAAAARVYRWSAARQLYEGFHTFPDEVTAMRWHGDRLWVATSAGAYSLDDAGQTTDLGLTFGPRSIAFTDDATYFADNAGMAARVRAGRVQLFRTPGVVTGDTQVYSYRGPIYRFSGIIYGEREALPSQLEVVGAVQELDGTVTVSTRRELHVSSPDGASWKDHDTSPASFTRAFAGQSPRYFVSEYTSQVTARDPKLWTTSAGIDTGWSQVTVPSSPLVSGLWWSPVDTTLFAVGDNNTGDAFFGVRRGTGQWETNEIPNCVARGVHGTDSSHVIAVGGCNGHAVVWSYNGTQWTELARPEITGGPLVAVVRFADGTIVAAGDNGAAVFDGTTWSVDTGAVGEALSGTSADDVWLSGTFTSVQHFDGTAWSKLAVQASGPIAVIATPERVMFPGATDGFVELVR